MARKRHLKVKRSTQPETSPEIIEKPPTPTETIPKMPSPNTSEAPEVSWYNLFWGFLGY